MNFNFIKTNNTLISNNNFNKLNGVDKIYVINLKRRPDRLQEFKNEIKKHTILDYNNDITYFEAIDGKFLKLTDKFLKLFRNNDFNYHPGVLGCFLSHYKIYEEIVNSKNINRVLIFEDDVKFKTKSFVKDWNNLYKKLPNDCGILVLQNSIKYHLMKFKDNDPIFSKNWVMRGHTTCSYVITKKMVYELLNYINNLKKQRAIDGVIFDYFRQDIKNFKPSNFHLHSHNGLSAYILKQPLCTFHLNYKSDIQNNY